MRLRNTPDSYGMVSRLLHWLMAAGVIGMLGLGTWIASVQPTMSNLWLYGLHKSIGLSLFGLVLVRLAWHAVSPVPRPHAVPGTWRMRLARLVHALIYVLLLAIPVSGWVASSATGIDTVFFGLWVVPPIAPPSERVSDLGFAIHGILTKAFAAILVAHVAGALSHGLGGRSALARMIA